MFTIRLERPGARSVEFVELPVPRFTAELRDNGTATVKANGYPSLEVTQGTIAYVMNAAGSTVFQIGPRPAKPQPVRHYARGGR